MPRKPRVFIGSSADRLDVAEAVLYNLDFTAEVTPWSAGLFDLSRSALESLLDSLDHFDFAIFVFSPDDIVRIRGEDQRAPRDNVLFELGLFVGRLGRDRCFVVVPRGTPDLHLPTDLAGYTPGTYQANRSDGNLKAALVHACSEIKDAFERVGLRDLPDVAPLAPEFEAREPTVDRRVVVDQRCTEPHDLGAAINEGDRYVAQTYTARVTGRLIGVNVSIWLVRRADDGQPVHPGHPLRITICGVQGAYPGEALADAALETGEVHIDDLVEFETPPAQVAGARYAIVADYPTAPPHGAGKCVGVWSGSADGSYPDGDLCYSKDGSTWFIRSLGQHDVHFRTYVDPELVVVPRTR